MQYRITYSGPQSPATIYLPGSKSINNRLLLMSALSGGNIHIPNPSDSDDSRIMSRIISSSSSTRNAGHAGTVMRFMTAYLSLQEGRHILTGSERMKNRPIKELVNALIQLGADIRYKEKDGFPPLIIKGKKLPGGKVEINSGISSQYISALLMIGPYLENGLQLKLTGDTISSSYIDMTISLMKQAGANPEKMGNSINVENGGYKEIGIPVEADWSSASYWFSIVGITGQKGIILPHLNSHSFQGDASITKLFRQLGVDSDFTPSGLELIPVPLENKTFRYDFRENPDMVQSFIPYCIARDIAFEFSGCRTLRIKETDRVLALYNELKKFKVILNFSEDGDYISWDGKTKPDWNQKISIDTYDDHRMALGMAPLSVKTDELYIRDPEVVSKSYPDFWKDIELAGFTIEIFD